MNKLDKYSGVKIVKLARYAALTTDDHALTVFFTGAETLNKHDSLIYLTRGDEAVGHLNVDPVYMEELLAKIKQALPAKAAA